MFKIQASAQVLEHCEDQIGKYNFARRGYADGKPEEQLTGIIGQSIVMDLFGLGYVDGEKGFDDGVDFVYNGKKVDVKTMGRTCDVCMDFTNNLLKAQTHFDTDIYLFCSYNKRNNELTVCGWISKEDCEKHRKFFAEGTWRTRANGTGFPSKADLYEIDMEYLNDVDSVEDLKSQLNQ